MPRTKRRRARTTQARPAEPESTSPDSDDCDGNRQDSANDEPQVKTGNDDTSSLNEARRKQEEEEDARVRLTNAHLGASNTIGSVYQRRWYLSLDRRACGFTERKRRGRSVWEKLPSSELSPDFQEAKSEESSCRLSFPFYVRGPRFEQSVVTGRLGEEVLRDEGVTTFVPRKGWTPVMK